MAPNVVADAAAGLHSRDARIKYIPGKGNQRVSDPPTPMEINWLHMVMLVIIPAVAVYYATFTPLRFPTLVLGFVTYFLAGFGITGGYHRMWSHKAWKAVPAVRLALLIFGAAAMEGSLRWWARNHRAHHKFTDTNKDPYNVRRGFFWAHLGWMIFKQDIKDIGRADIADLDADPLIRWQHRYYGPIAITSGFVVPTLIAGFGWGDFQGGLIWASLCRMIFVHHSTFCINSVAHYLGDRGFSDLHSAADSFITAILTLGEGYHNYHHEFPQDYRNGIKWYHYDPTKWTIKFLYDLGLAYDLVSVPDNEVKKAELQMEQTMLDECRNGESVTEFPAWTMAEFNDKVRKEGRQLVILEGAVYDVEHFLDQHPGGRLTLSNELGKDITDKFNGKSGESIHSKDARTFLRRLRVARLAN